MMNIEAHYYGKTKITVSHPWGLMDKTGSKVLCGDGVIRSLAYLASTPDTFFSTPAAVRIKGKYITGYMSVTEGCSEDYKVNRRAYTFHPHTESNAKHGNILPEFPSSFTPELFALLECGEEAK